VGKWGVSYENCLTWDNKVELGLRPRSFSGDNMICSGKVDFLWNLES
jgi:hypothetical protein